MLSGTLGGDAEVRQTEIGPIVSFSIAVSSNFKDKNGEWQEKTEWTRCTMFKGEGLAKYLTKGTKVFISGVPKFKAYTNKLGEPAVMPEIAVNTLDFVSKNRVEEDFPF